MTRYGPLLSLTYMLLLGGCSLLSPFSDDDDQPTIGSLTEADLPEISATETGT